MTHHPDDDANSKAVALIEAYLIAAVAVVVGTSLVLFSKPLRDFFTFVETYGDETWKGLQKHEGFNRALLLSLALICVWFAALPNVLHTVNRFAPNFTAPLILSSLAIRENADECLKNNLHDNPFLIVLQAFVCVFPFRSLSSLSLAVALAFLVLVIADGAVINDQIKDLVFSMFKIQTRWASAFVSVTSAFIFISDSLQMLPHATDGVVLLLFSLVLFICLVLDFVCFLWWKRCQSQDELNQKKKARKKSNRSDKRYDYCKASHKRYILSFCVIDALLVAVCRMYFVGPNRFTSWSVCVAFTAILATFLTCKQ
jgi:hypothetical protein